MKKTRLFQSVMMLLACVALLVVGIYAVSPAQNNVTGTITVIASNVEVEITAYLGANKATKISDTITTRTSKPVPIKDGSIKFDGSSATSTDSVSDLILTLEIKNKSASKKLGAFFLKDGVLPETLTRSNITTSMSFDGETEDGKNTSANLVTFALQDYTKIGAGQTVDLICTLSLNSLTDYDMLVDFSLPLVIHDYNEDLSLSSSSVTVSTDSDKSVEIETAVGNSSYSNGVISSTTKLKKGLSDVEFTTESTDPIEVAFTITNKTNTELGVCFLDSSVSESVAYDSNGLVTADGIMVKTQIKQNGNTIDVYLSTYSYLAKGGDANNCDSIEMLITFYPTAITSYCSVMFEFNLDIEEYVSNMNASVLNAVSSSWTSSNGSKYGCVKSIPSNLIKIPSSVTQLSQYAFSLCEYGDSGTLVAPPEWNGYVTKYIVLPASITTIEGDCFSKNTDLLGVFIPSSVIDTNMRMFFFCTNLSSVTLSTSCSYVAHNCFTSCASLVSVKLPDNITSLMYGCFSYSGISRIVIPSGVTHFDSGAFEDCTSLTTIIIKQGTSGVEYDGELPTISGKTWYLNGVEVTTTKLVRSAICDNIYICK